MDPGSSPYSPERDAAMPDHIPKFPRGTMSLTVLASRFVGLLQVAENAEMDLNEAVRVLAVQQKRRIYDITNVLEGVGLIVKRSKNLVKWKGPIPGKNAQELTKRLTKLRTELEYLEQNEYVLDQQKFWIEQSIMNTREQCSNLSYVNHEDICNSFSGHTLLLVQAPSGTQLDVPIPKAVQNCPARYQIHLKSVNGPIDVTLLNKRSVSSAPVVLPVPPPENMLLRASSAMSTSDETGNSFPPCQAAGYTNHIPRSRQTALENMQHLQTSSEPKRTNASELQDLSKELKELLQPTKKILNANIIKELLGSEVFSPLLRLSPPPSEQDYSCNLHESEGVCDLFDTPMLNA